MEAAAARKIEGRPGDDAAGELHRPLRRFEIASPDDGERRRSGLARIALDAHVDAGGFDPVIGQVRSR